MATFPAYAKILRAGFSEKRGKAVEHSEMEDGFVKQARVRSRVMIQRPVSVLLNSKADYLAFVEWFKTDISEGADWFNWNDPVSGTVKSVRFVANGLEASPVGAISNHWEIRNLVIEGWGI